MSNTSCSSKMGWYFSRESFLSIPESSSVKRDQGKSKNHNIDTVGLETIQTPSRTYDLYTIYSVIDLWLQSSWLNLYRLQVPELEVPRSWSQSLEFGRATQGHSETWPKATPALTWLYSSGCHHAERLNITTVCIWLQWPVSFSCCWEALPYRDAASTMLHCGDGISQLIAALLLSSGFHLATLP